MPDLDDEWEYEYDTKDTEVFLVDLDLSTVNQSVRYSGANRHKRLNEITGASASKKRKVADKPTENDGVATLDAGSGTPASGQPSTSSTSQLKGLQVLDLSSGNPIVAYGGEVFTCKWTDMVGTTMFFTQPREAPLYDVEISTRDYELIGTSRLKLVGTKAKVTPIQQQVISTGKPIPQGQSLGTIRRNNAKVNADLRKQASFLEQLMNIKKDRGENDNVFVAMNENIAASVSAGKSKNALRSQAKKIEALNHQAVKGSANALEQIEQIYLSLKNDAVDEVPKSPTSIQQALDDEDSDAEYEVEPQPRILGTASASPEPASFAPDVPLTIP